MSKVLKSFSVLNIRVSMASRQPGNTL